MSVFDRIVRRLRAAVRRTAADRELDDEIRFHLEREQEKNQRAGMTADAARRQALVAFGGVQQVREAHREVRSVHWLDDLAGDARFALRTLAHRPALAGAAILTLALGVGANTAIFSVVDAVILRPLPFPAPDRLAMLWEENPEKNWHLNVAAPANYLDWKEQVRAFQDVAAYEGGSGHATLTGLGTPQFLTASGVTGNFFSVLGVRPELGRGFQDDETWDTTRAEVVLSDRAWRTRFGADPRIVGRTIRLEGHRREVIGVMPPGFAFPEDVDLWVPVGWNRADRSQVWFRRAHWLRVVARLRPGVTMDDADAQLQVVVRRLQQQYPATNRVMGAGLTPLHEFLIGDTRAPLLILLAASALLLVIACANVGNLMLVHATGRSHEVALRLALGAGPGRLVRQVLTESVVLAAFGGVAGAALAWTGTKALTRLQPGDLVPVSDVHVDAGVLGYTLAITALSAAVFGIVPALWSARRAPGEALKEGGRGRVDGVRMRRWGDGLAVAELALALLLTLGAGLLVRSLWRLQHVPPGFDPHGALALSLELPNAGYDTSAKVLAFDDALLQRIRAIPGVTDAAITSRLPLTGTSWTSDFSIAGRGADEYGSEVAHREVGTNYFRAMRVPVLAGRAFGAGDRERAGRVVIINDALARRFFPGQSPLGQQLCFDRVPDSASVWRTIVGVVGSEHQSSLALAPQIEIYSPQAQDATNELSVVARVAEGRPLRLAPSMRAAVAAIDPQLAVISTQSLDDVVAASMSRARFLTTLLLVFATVGLALAVVGVYGVMAQLAQRRMREMGIRMALGAPATQVRWLIVRHSLTLLGPGLVVGVAAALLATRALTSLLYGVAPSDPATFILVPLLLAITGLVASWLPALHASRADPAGTLRSE